MNTITQEQAAEYASWFRCLADGTRLRVLNFVAEAEAPLTVGEIVDAVGKSQSTVSRHLAILAADRFVLMENDGIRTRVSVNRACMVELPKAASQIMGQAMPR